ncbi:hypothetical protein WJX73_000178 [Symbiochloris irregularis]|uniref:NADH dehydrogenase subunit 6 n=1 Tax=Symbiochloris irregularis TaxID=706552 RepID=A0AAW1NMI5_9CHLO
MWLEDILYGALTPGVNEPTVVVVHVALLGCIASLLFLLAIVVNISWSLTFHVCMLLVLAIGLLLLFSWFMQQLSCEAV